jgi:predicted nuclease of predicted toxin-antitoxin system
MAENRKKPLNIVAFACRARYFLVTEDQDLKVLVALHTTIFKYRHGREPPCKILIS